MRIGRWLAFTAGAGAVIAAGGALLRGWLGARGKNIRLGPSPYVPMPPGPIVLVQAGVISKGGLAGARMTEADLRRALSELGHPPPEDVDLVVRQPDGRYTVHPWPAGEPRPTDGGHN